MKEDKMTSTVVSEEETAKGLGFFNVAAFREWKTYREEIEFLFPGSSLGRDLMVEICNLKQQIKSLQEEINHISDRLIATGTERI